MATGNPKNAHYGRKLVEAARAQNLEKVTDKQTILEAYLNRLEYGHGPRAPKQQPKVISGLRTQPEFCTSSLSGSIATSTVPFLDRYDHHDRVVLRQRALLDALHEAGVLNDANLSRAKSEPIRVRRLNRPSTHHTLLMQS